MHNKTKEIVMNIVAWGCWGCSFGMALKWIFGIFG